MRTLGFNIAYISTNFCIATMVVTIVRRPRAVGWTDTLKVTVSSVVASQFWKCGYTGFRTKLWMGCSPEIPELWRAVQNAFGVS